MIIVYEDELPEIFDDIYYTFFKTKLIELKRISNTIYCFYIKLVSKTDYIKGIKAIYDVYCDEGLYWELNVFKEHFIFPSNHISSEYEIITISENKNLSNCPKEQLVIKYK